MLLGGDFNLPGIDWTDMSTRSGAHDVAHCEQLMDMTTRNKLDQVVRETTRLNNTLDLLFTTHPGLISRSTTGPGVSDHDQLVIVDTDLRASVNKKRPRNIQLFSKADWNEIRADFGKFEDKFFSTLPSQRTVEENWTQFKSAVLGGIEKWVPTKRTRVKNDLPWMTRELLHLKRRKQRAHTKAKQSRSDKDWARFRHLRKVLRQHMNTAYMDYVNNLVNPEDDPSNKKLWRYLKSRKQDHVGVSPLKSDGNLITTALGKADILNKQFASVFTDENVTDKPDKGPSSFTSLPNIKINRNGVESLLRKIKPRKASGPDLIPARFLQEMADPISTVLTFIYQQSLDEGRVPDDWRTANVAPIFKKGDRSIAANYRPVSLTALACKTLEHIVVRNILDHLDAHNILSDFQHGFRARRSCETQLIITTQDIATALNNRKQVDLVILDFSKAFDKVPHQRLLHKL